MVVKIGDVPVSLVRFVDLDTIRKLAGLRIYRCVSFVFIKYNYLIFGKKQLLHLLLHWRLLSDYPIAALLNVW